MELFRKTEKGIVRKHFEVTDIPSAKARGWYEPIVEKEMVELKKEPKKTKKPKVKHDNKN